MERKSGSSSRSPSLSRRPSLKDKKPTVISKSKKKGTPGVKKERWLLTRKTWRYMTDAVGNLLPEYRGGSRRGSTYPAASPPASAGLGFSSAGGVTAISEGPQPGHSTSSQGYGTGSSRGGGTSPPSHGVSMSPTGRSTVSPPGQQLLQQQQQLHQQQVFLHQQQLLAQMQSQSHHQQQSITTASSSSSGGGGKTTTSPTSSAFPWGSFPSHRPGVTPTGPGPGSQGTSTNSSQAALRNPRHPAVPIDPEDIPAIEKHFNDVCTKEKKFLLWTRTKPKSLSGPALRDLKLKQQEQEQQKESRSPGSPSEGAAAASCGPSTSRHATITSTGQKGFLQQHHFQRHQSVDHQNKEHLFSPDYYSPEEEFGDEDDYDEYENEEEQVTVRERRKSSTASSTMSIIGGPGMSFFRPLSTVSMSSGVGITGTSDTSYAMIMTPSGVQKILRNTGIQTDPFPEELLIRLRLQAVHEDRQKQLQMQLQGIQQGQQAGSGGFGGQDQQNVEGFSEAESGPGATSCGGSGSNIIRGSGNRLSRGAKETVIPISHEAGLSHERSADSDIKSGRESEEKILDKSSLDKGASSEGKGGSIVSSSAQESSSTTGTDVTDKKSEESGYSSSISDTVMRYLRMVRKNSKADNKETIDKFKTVNYDRSLRYIKSKNVTVEEALEHEKNKALGIGQGPAPGSPPSPLPNLPDSSRVTKGQGQPGQTGTALSVTSINTGTTTSPPISPVGGSSSPTGKSPSGSAIAPISPNMGQGQSLSSPGSTSPTPSSVSPGTASSISQTKPTPVKVQKSKKGIGTESVLLPGLVEAGVIDNAVIDESDLPPDEPPPPPPHKECPSVGIQAGESLIRFLKNFNPTRKFSDFSSATSYCSSESPVEITSPRYSIATTVMSSASEGDNLYLQQHQAALASMMATGMLFMPGELSNMTTGTGGGSGIGVPSTARSSFDMYSAADSSEFDDVFNNYQLLYQQSAQFTQQQQYQQQKQQQQSFQQVQEQSSASSSYQQYSSTSSSIAAATASSMLTTKIRKSSSAHGVSGTDISPGSSIATMKTCPSTTSMPTGFGGGTTYSYSSSGSGGLLTQIQPGSSTTYSSRHHHQPHQYHHHHQSHLGLNASSSTSSTGGIGIRTKTSASTPNTPIAGGSSSSSMSGSASGGGLMKSFFSSSPFSSSFGLGSKVGFGLGLKKPTSTTSLVTPSVSTPVTGHSGNNALTLLDSSYLPPTTSSSPNLLSLIHSSSSSIIQGGSRTCASVSGSIGGGSARELLAGSIPTASSDVISKQQQKQQQRASQGASVSFKGSLVTQKGHMSLPVGISDSKSGTAGAVPSSTSSGSGPSRPSSYTERASGLFSRGGGSGSGTPQGGNPGFAGLLTSSGSSTVMQKSKSSSSVLPVYGSSAEQQRTGAGAGGSGTPAAGHSTSGPSGGSRLMMSKSRIFKSRSKSSTRASSGSGTCTWAPQGKCKWKSANGKVVSLEDTTVLALSELERQKLQEVALEKLKTLNLGVDVKIPKEKTSNQKPKRRPYLIKKRALSTGFFDSATKREESKEINAGSGMVFGISLSQCVANDRIKGLKSAAAAAAATSSAPGIPATSDWEQNVKRSQNGSRNSVSSVCETVREEKDSDESLFWGRRGSVAVDTIGAGDVLGDLQPPPISVPAIVTACVKHLENYGLHTTGIFRVSTSLKRIRQLREEIDGGKEIQFGEEHSPHDVAALLKEFLRDLPDPLLSRELYQGFLKTLKIRNRKSQLEAVQHLVQLLPVPNRDTLASLLTFFNKVVSNAAETRSNTGEILPGNKMESYSLATLIAPNILPCMPIDGAIAISEMNLTKERRESIDVVNFMISNYKTLFDVPSELLHDVYLNMMDTQPEAVEGILKQKFGPPDEMMDDQNESGSVFEGSESEHAEVEEATISPPKPVRRREDFLHKGAGKCGNTSDGDTTRLERTRERCRGKRESSRERQSDVEKQQSGAESDSSSTKSTSRWFRRTRGDNKTRTSSDSGSEKVKGSKSRESSLHESKRASSLDSVNIKEPVPQGSSSTAKDDRQKSSSDQSLKVPDNYNRRQSSPVLESSGVITASLKIPVPVPLNIDDTDIPFIEDDHHEGVHLTSHIHSFHQRAGYHQQAGKSRGRSASTDSSALVRTPSSSHTTTPISSPQRQPSSELSSPVGFSPPGSPPYEPNTFPYEEMTARILIGAPSPITSAGSLQQSSYVQSSIPAPSLSTVTTSVSTSESKSAGSTPTTRPKVENKMSAGATSAQASSTSATAKVSVASLYLQPSANSGLGAASAPVSPQPSISDSSSSAHIPSVADSKGMGKETKGANISGLIKSKTADFEKLAKSSATTAGISTTSTYSIAPKMRLRSQDNIMLKQQFLLRQQQGEGGKSGVRRSNSISKEGREEGGSGTTTTVTTTTASGDSSPSRSSGHRSLTRRRHLMGSASSSAIISTGGDNTTTHSSSQPIATSSSRSPSASQPVSVTVRSSTVGGGTHQGTPPLGSSPSRWKRSEIIASRHQSQSTQDPETFV